MSLSRASFVTFDLIAAAGCQHAQVKQNPVTEAAVTNPAANPVKDQTKIVQQPADDQKQNDADRQAREELNRVLAQLRDISIFFAFDSSTLTPEGEEKLAQVGQILGAHPKLSIRIEGNCDERGTEDYNLSLGQSRADEARKYIMSMGAQADQVKTVSYGDERPKATGHSEEAWKQNRRDDIVIAD